MGKGCSGLLGGEVPGDPLLCAVPVELEHEQADCRRQVCALAVLVNFGDQIGKGALPRRGDFLQARPERIFQADAGLVTPDHDGSLDHGGCHTRVMAGG